MASTGPANTMGSKQTKTSAGGMCSAVKEETSPDLKHKTPAAKTYEELAASMTADLHGLVRHLSAQLQEEKKKTEAAQAEAKQAEQRYEDLRNAADATKAGLQAKVRKANDERASMKAQLAEVEPMTPKNTKIVKAAKAVTINSAGKDWEQHGRRMKALQDAVNSKD